MPPLAVVAGTAIVGAGLKAFGGNKAAKGEKLVVQARQRQAELQAARERIKSVREARIKRGEILQNAENAGAGSSSAAAGGAQSIESQLSSSLQFVGDIEQTNVAIAEGQKKQVSGAQIAGIGGGVASVGSSLFGAGAPFGTT